MFELPIEILLVRNDVDSGKRCLRSVREVLSWFHDAREEHLTKKKLRHALRELKLATKPDVSSASLRSHVWFYSADQSTSAAKRLKRPRAYVPKIDELLRKLEGTGAPRAASTKARHDYVPTSAASTTAIPTGPPVAMSMNMIIPDTPVRNPPPRKLLLATEGDRLIVSDRILANELADLMFRHGYSEAVMISDEGNIVGHLDRAAVVAALARDDGVLAASMIARS